MKRRILIGIKIIILLVLLLFCGRFIHMVILPTDADNTGSRGIEKFNAFYSLKRNTLDVVFIGSSHNNFAFIPMIVDEENELDSMVMGAHGLSIFTVPYYIEEICKTQNPKIVVVELFSLYGDLKATSEKSEDIHRYTDGMRLSPLKIKMVNDLVLNGNKKEHIFPVIFHHASWKNEEFVLRLKHFFDFGYERNPYFGYEPATIHYSEEKGIPAFKPSQLIPSDSVSIQPFHYESLKKIVTICEKNDITLIFTISPSMYRLDDPNDAPAADLMAMAELLIPFLEENDIPLYNYIALSDEIALTTYDFFDSAHLNTLGAEKVTRHFSEILASEYSGILSDCTWDYEKKSRKEYETLLKQN